MVMPFTFYLDDDFNVESYTLAFGEMLKFAKESQFFPRHITRQIVSKDMDRYCMSFTYIFDRPDEELHTRRVGL